MALFVCVCLRKHSNLILNVSQEHKILWSYTLRIKGLPPRNPFLRKDLSRVLFLFPFLFQRKNFVRKSSSRIVEIHGKDSLYHIINGFSVEHPKKVLDKNLGVEKGFWKNILEASKGFLVEPHQCVLDKKNLEYKRVLCRSS